VLSVETREIPAIFAKLYALNSSLSCRRTVKRNTRKNREYLTLYLIAFLFLFGRDVNAYLKLSRNSPTYTTTLRSNSHALKGISGVCNVVGKKHTSSCILFLKFFAITGYHFGGMHVTFCVKRCRNA